MMLSHLVILFSLYKCSMQHNLPVKITPVVISSAIPGACPSAEAINVHTNAMLQEIENKIQNVVNPKLANRRRCSCSRPGRWTKIAYLNTTDPSQDCPTNWRLVTSPVRACGRRSSGCNSAFFPSNGRNYSHVCGQVIAYQKGTTDAFFSSIVGNPSLEGAYVDGISLTHGAAGSRKHIWTFTSALNQAANSQFTCSCTNSNQNWPYQVPSFIGNDYFCDSGSAGPATAGVTYTDNLLWDGEGCGPTSTCCQFNNPPWFCTTLPQATTDDIEL